MLHGSVHEYSYTHSFTTRTDAGIIIVITHVSYIIIIMPPASPVLCGLAVPVHSMVAMAASVREPPFRSIISLQKDTKHHMILDRSKQNVPLTNYY